MLGAVGPHGVHSPFVFELITRVWVPRNQFYAFAQLRAYRQALLENRSEVPLEDFGAGSLKGSASHQRVAHLARVAGQTPLGVERIFQLAHRLRTGSVLELGSSVGLSTAAFGLLGKHVKVHSVEGNKELARFTQTQLHALGLSNVHIHAATFDDVLGTLLRENEPFDMVYVDGNHRKEPTLRYWNTLAQHASEKTVVIFDDIHWSEEMTEAWQIIVSDSRVTLSLDLYRMGIVFLDSGFSKEHFLLRVKM